MWKEIKSRFEWSQLYVNLYGVQSEGLPAKAKEFIDLVLSNEENVLYQRSIKLNSIIGERVSVLPPDTRHVDYEVIPLTIADGCLYHCKFCCVKSEKHFRVRSKDDVQDQIYPLGVTDTDYCVLKFTAQNGRFYSDFSSESFEVKNL